MIWTSVSILVWGAVQAARGKKLSVSAGMGTLIACVAGTPLVGMGVVALVVFGVFGDGCDGEDDKEKGI